MDKKERNVRFVERQNMGMKKKKQREEIKKKREEIPFFFANPNPILCSVI